MAQNSPALTTRPGDRADALEQMSRRGEELRTEIGRNVIDVRSRAREAFDLQRQIARHPYVAAAVVLGGVLVATSLVRALVRGVRGPRERDRGSRGKRFRALATEPGAGSKKRARHI